MLVMFSIYGHETLCRILRDNGIGSYDVERLSDGKCFRVSGFPIVFHRD